MTPKDERSVRDLLRLRRYTFFTVIGCGPLALFVSAMFLAQSYPDGSVLPFLAGALTVSVACTTGALALHWHGGELWRRHSLWAVAAALLVAGAVVEAVRGGIGAAWAAPAGLLLAEASLWARPGRRARVIAVGSAAVVAATAALALVGGVAMPTLLVTAVLVPSMAVGIVCQLWHYRVAQELEDARGLAAELAVAEERLRFASELHDVQGGNLQAITLKAQVARRLIAADPERAAAEVRAVEELARSALKDTREVVGGYRKVALADEIDSAARILKSAGVQATVPDAVPGLDEDAEKLLGLLVREATTNLIRHAEPSAAHLSLVEVDAAITVTVTNNGAPEPTGGGNGLSMLKDRFGEAGGSVEHRHDGDRFELRGTLPRPRAEQAAPQRARVRAPLLRGKARMPVRRAPR